MLDKKTKPSHPIILHFNIDPEPVIFFLHCLMEQGPGISKLSLVTYNIYTNKHFWELARHLAQTCSCVRGCYAGAHTLRHTHTDSRLYAHRQIRTIEKGGGVLFCVFVCFFRVTVTNKSSLK